MKSCAALAGKTQMKKHTLDPLWGELDSIETASTTPIPFFLPFSGLYDRCSMRDCQGRYVQGWVVGQKSYVTLCELDLDQNVMYVEM